MCSGVSFCPEILSLGMIQSGLNKSYGGHLEAYEKCFVWKGLLNSSNRQVGAVLLLAKASE